MRVKMTLFSLLILAATLVVAQQSRFGDSSSPQADSHSLMMQGCLGTSFQEGNYTLTNAQTATVYTLTGSEDMRSYVGKQVEVVGETSPADYAGKAEASSETAAASAETSKVNAGAQTVNVSKVTKLAEHCLLSNKMQSTSQPAHMRLVALNEAGQTGSQASGGSGQSATPSTQSSPQTSPQPSSPPQNSNPNAQPPAGEPGNQPGTATPPPSSATPPGSTATPPGSSATPPGNTTPPPGNTATPNGSQPCAGTPNQGTGTTNCGTPNTTAPGTTAPNQGTQPSTPQTTPNNGAAPPKAKS